jgi:hypothetical protein
MSYFCDICKKEYKSYKSFWNHNSNVHPNENIIIDRKDNKKRDFSCEKCNKKFTTKQSMIYHNDNTCKIKENIAEIMKDKIEKLERKIEQLQNNNPHNTTNNTTTNNNNNTTNNNNTNNGTVNNIIYINKFGTENIADLNENEVKEIFSKNLESIIKFVQHLNFNARLPSNHNFCTTSLDGQYLSIYNTDKPNIGQLKERKKYFFEDLLHRSVNRMEQLYNKNKKNFPNKKQKQIEEDIETLKTIRDKDMNDILLREMLKKLNLLSYNYKEIILNTWNNPDVTVKEKTFEEDLDEEDMDIKEIESLFIISNDTENEINYTPVEPDNNDDDYSISSDRPKLVAIKK